MRVLFVRPNRDTFGYKPVGISILSAVCKREGHEVRLFDTTFIDLGVEMISSLAPTINKYKPVDFSSYGVQKVRCDLRQEVTNAVKEFRPDVCAFSLTSDEQFVARDISRFIKDCDHQIQIVWGGPHPTVAVDETMSLPDVDFACVGEGLEALPELLNALEEGKDPTSIRNICAKQNGAIVRNELRPLYSDLDSLPYLDWDIFDKRQFLKPFDGKIVICGDFMANWGCPYHCAYCINSTMRHYTKRRVRRFSPERAIRELKFQKDRYGLNFITFKDEDFLMRPLSQLREFAHLYVREIGLPFAVKTHPCSVYEEKVELLVNMGVAAVSVGVESGNEYIRKHVLKRVDSLDHVRRAFCLLNGAGVRTGAYIMMGLPFENRSRIFDSIELCRELRPSLVEHGFFFPFQGSELYEVCVENGFYDKDKVPIFNWFVPTLTLPDISREELMGILKTFSLYVKLPTLFRRLIERAERDDLVGNEIYAILSATYNDQLAAEESAAHFPKGDVASG